MNNPTNNDLHRDMGRMEGQITAIKEDVADIKNLLERLDKRLDRIEARENQLRGIWWILAAVGGGVGSVTIVLLGHFWK